MAVVVPGRFGAMLELFMDGIDPFGVHFFWRERLIQFNLAPLRVKSVLTTEMSSTSIARVDEHRAFNDGCLVFYFSSKQ